MLPLIGRSGIFSRSFKKTQRFTFSAAISCNQVYIKQWVKTRFLEVIFNCDISNVLKFSDLKQFLLTCEDEPAKVIPNPLFSLRTGYLARGKVRSLAMRILRLFLIEAVCPHFAQTKNPYWIDFRACMLNVTIGEHTKSGHVRSNL